MLQDDSIEQWLFSTLTVHGVLEDSGAVKDRVVLENVPLGLEYLNTIVKAIKTNHRTRWQPALEGSGGIYSGQRRV